MGAQRRAQSAIEESDASGVRTVLGTCGSKRPVSRHLRTHFSWAPGSSIGDQKLGRRLMPALRQASASSSLVYG